MSRPGPDHKVRDLKSRFREAFLALARPGRGESVLVAFSGGPDSTALLHLCLTVRDELGFDLSAAHLDHGLRGAEAERDRLAAQGAAERVGVPFYWDRVDCRALAREGSLSLEEAAREARYSFIERIGQEIGAVYAATGHTADDNAEAVLLNLLRGAGPRGLAGIPPVRQGRILRPLLGFWREELLDWLAARDLSFVEDSSNRDLNLTRNKVRHDMLPRLIRDFNPGLKAALVRTAAVIRDEEKVWDSLLSELRPRVGWEVRDGRVSMKSFEIAALDRALGQVRQVLWTVGAVLHGEGYLAWMSFSLLLIFLFVLRQ